MPEFNARSLYASADTPDGARIVAIVSGACAENDILVANGLNGRLMQLVRADADAIVTARGFLWVALGAWSTGSRIEAVPWRVVRNVNTAAGAMGDPVFMSSTAGGWTLTAPVGVAVVQVGEVLVSDATAGAVVLAPNAPFGMLDAVVGVTDPGTGNAISTGFNSASVDFTVAAGAAETNTLAVPSYQGQRLHLVSGTVGAAGSRAVTVAAAINQTGNTIMTFAAANDWILLEGVRIAGVMRWRVAANDGVALS